MATLERLSQPGPSSLAGEGASASPLVELAPEVPSPFPSDQPSALRREPQQQGGVYAREREVSITSLDSPPSLDGHLPPGYEEGETDPFLDPHHPHAHHDLPPPSHDDDDATHIPPTYPHEERPSFDDHEDYPREKPSSTSSNLPPSSSSTADDASSEKMRLDLDSVTAAISRLYDVAPQMGDQRVELNARKRDEMDLARMVGRGKMTDQVAESKGKARETKEQELGQIWERIEQAHGRRLGGQEAEMRPSGSASAKKERDLKKQAFMEGVADRTSAGRMHGQDSSPPSFVNGVASASSSSTTTKEQQDLITVGQFIRELGTNAVPPTTSSRRTSLSQASTPPASSSSSTPPPAAATSNPPPTTSSRRSSFVPAFVEAALQRRASIKNNPSQDSLPDVGFSSSSSRPPSRQVGYRYLAEFQESIRVVQVRLELEEVLAGTELEVVIVEGEEKEVRISSSKDGWEIKIPLPGSARPLSFKVITTASNPSSTSSTSKHTIPSSTISFRLPTQPSSSSSSSQPTSPPLSAPFLASLAPTSLACSTCSTPIVNTSLLLNPQTAYKDLPSEHWEELVGSWLCHDEMKLALGVEDGKGGGGGGGFWPREGEVLVGGNYVLVGDGLVLGGVGAGVWRVREGAESETWQPIECSTCSSPLGRRFNHPSIPPTSTFKFQKYAIKPIGSSTSSSSPPPPTFPLSIFIASDLLELADVHRCYHFIVYSEEEPLVPLILIWLLNPSLQITLGSTSASSSNEEARGPFRAAKLMFQTSPSLPSTIPPAFDAAEPLHYPSSICTQLATELERSHASYPGRSGGGMMGLKGGWLERW